MSSHFEPQDAEACAKSVLVISHDLIGPQMAGSGIRYWELAKVLATNCSVILAAPEGSSRPHTHSSIQWAEYTRNVSEPMRRLVDSAQIVVVAGDSLIEFPFLLETDKYVVMDGYDPHTLESLAWNQAKATQERLHSYHDRLRIVQFQCRVGDFFICASERQRMHWLGWLESAGRINPLTYDHDPSLRQLIDVVPTGLPVEPPQRTKPLVKGVIPGISEQDFLLVWGGGIWNWLDPLTLIRAVTRVADTHPYIRLYFPGARHPYQQFVPDMEMHQKAVQLSQELGVWQKHVFVGDWVSYDERQNYLLEADVGCSLHYETVESYLAFRTRILDYIWAGLPMIVTCGDAMSELVEKHNLGMVVNYQDLDGVVDAILRLMDMPRAAFQPQFEHVQRMLTWEQNAQPLLRFCRHPRRAPDKALIRQQQQAQVSLDCVIEQDREIARLRGVIAGYERGRFIRLMRWLRKTQEWMKRIGHRQIGGD